MNLVITMRPATGDQHVTKATIKMYDKDGADVGGQFLLEAETAETQLTVPPGGRCEVKEYERPIVYNPETCGAEYADLTPKDPLKKKLDEPPPTTATPKGKDDQPKAGHVAPPASPRPKY